MYLFCESSGQLCPAIESYCHIAILKARLPQQGQTPYLIDADSIWWLGGFFLQIFSIIGIVPCFLPILWGFILTPAVYNERVVVCTVVTVLLLDWENHTTGRKTAMQCDSHTQTWKPSPAKDKATSLKCSTSGWKVLFCSRPIPITACPTAIRWPTKRFVHTWRGCAGRPLAVCAFSQRQDVHVVPWKK